MLAVWSFKKLCKDLFMFLLCVNILPACMCMYHMDARGLQCSEKGSGSPGTEVTDGCEPCGGWESNLSPLEINKSS